MNRTWERIALALLLGTWGAAVAMPYRVTLDTPFFFSGNAQLALDLTDGDAAQNFVAISNWAGDARIMAQTPTGDVTGALPGFVALGDGSFFNELLVELSLGSRLTFDFEASSNAPTALVPDAFSAFLVDPATGVSLVTTADPTGANALFTFDIDGSADGWLNNYAVGIGGLSLRIEPIGVPGPSTVTLVLLAAAVMPIAFRLHRR